MSTRTKQTLLIAAGLIIALVGGVLGMWQMQVFVDKGNRSIEARAELPATPLFDHIHPDNTTDDIYGKPVTITGHYLAGSQLLIPAGDAGVRVLQAFQSTDGRVVPVVRGTTQTDQITSAPVGDQTQTGLFLPGEGDAPAPNDPGTIGSVRMPLLAQKWPEYELVPGFVTLCEKDAGAQGLQQAAVDLPEGKGSFQNGGYALQWWVFGGFALLMTIKWAQVLGRKETKAREESARAELRK